MANGFANRFTYLLVHRARFLPFGGHPSEDNLEALAVQLRQAATTPRGEMSFAPDAERLWRVAYQGELAAEHDGLVGVLFGRAETKARRYAVTYAALDCRRVIGPADVEAGLAIVRYELASLRWIFGDAIGDETADKLYQAIRQAGTNGLSLSEQSKVFGRNTAKADLDRARKILTERGRIETYDVATDGRRKTRHQARWGDATPTKETKETKEAPRTPIGPPFFRLIRFFRTPTRAKEPDRYPTNRHPYAKAEN